MKHSLSAIIPTIGRTSLRDAVTSALLQQDCDVEVIVVLDRPENVDLVKETLEGLDYKLLTVNGIGASGARNVGLRAATKEYIAYLDDDDIWRPTKSLNQIKSIEAKQRQSRTKEVFAGCSSIHVRSNRKRSKTLSRSFTGASGAIANHLVERKSLKYQPSNFHTSALFAPRSLLLRFEWDTTLRKHQDWDLFIRLASNENISYCTVETIGLEISQGSQGSISMRSQWKDGSAFLHKHSDRITGRARADFILLHIVIHALQNRSTPGLREAFTLHQRGFPHLAAVLRFFAGLILFR